MPSTLRILQGELFRSDADAILISIDDKQSPTQIRQKLLEHWRIDFPVSGNIPFGDFITSPVPDSIRGNNGNPENYLLFTNFGNEAKRRLSNLVDFLPTLATFSRKHPLVREIAIQMDDDWAETDQMRFLFNHFYSRFFPAAHPDCGLEIFFENRNDTDRMKEFYRQYLNTRNSKLKLAREYQQESAGPKLLNKRYYILRGFAQQGTEWINPSSSLLRDYEDVQILEVFRDVPKGSLIFQSSSVSSDMEFFPVSAIGEVVENLNGNFQMNWFSEGFTGHVKNLGYPLRSINEIVQGEEKRKMYELLKGSLFPEFTHGNAEVENSLPPRPLKNVELVNDFEIGEDYLEIADDVDAFARIIALRDLRPPLAIALCGKWGSGKSFFMGKMIKKISALSSSGGELFCKGIAHIEFNAWSYLDSNLWAGLVTRIFNGINQYVNKYIHSEALLNEIKTDLDAQVSLSHQSIFKMEAEKVKINGEITELNQRRDALDKQLKADMSKLRNKSYTEFFNTAMEGFEVQKKIDTALAQNKSVREVSSYIKAHFPNELWADSKWLDNQVSWFNVFFRDFFSRKRIWFNVAVLVPVLFLLYFFPQLFNNLLTLLRKVNIDFSKQTWAWIAVAGTVSTKAVKSYRKIQPLFSALWEVKKRYIEKSEDTQRKWVQESQLLNTQIEVDQQKLKQLDDSLVDTREKLAKVEFRLLNRLNTEAFENFLKDKTGERGYRKHQGIVATIRDDFETLSGLFEKYARENRQSEHQDIPLERIVLYIDDLDRCDESRVLEVLQAVHLIMALNLFVVVVGIDPGRVKSALASQLRSNRSPLDPHLPSKYLEKIFQVPFHLNEPGDRAVKFMIDQLLQPKKTEEASVVPTRESNAESPVIEEIRQEISEEVQKNITQNPLPEGPMIEKLLIDQQEITRIGEFSVLIGSNPRSVKRFVNILRIIRAHVLPDKSPECSEELVSDIISFLLALSTGPCQLLYRPLTAFLRTKPAGSLNNFLTSIADPQLQVSKEMLNGFLQQESQQELLNAPLDFLAAYNVLIRRFSFEDLT